MGLKPVPVLLKKSKKSLPLKGISISLIKNSSGSKNSKTSSVFGKGKPIPFKEPSTGKETKKALFETLKSSLKAFFQSHQWSAKFEKLQSKELFLKGKHSALHKTLRGAGFNFKELKEISQAKTFSESFRSSSVRSPTPAPASKIFSFLETKPPKAEIKISTALFWGIAQFL